MSKKLLSLILLLTAGVLLTGCNDVIDLTDTETKLIAEYAGELMLKYDVYFVDRLYEGEKIEKEMEEEGLSDDEDTSETSEEITEASTEATTEASTEDANKGKALNNQIDDTGVDDGNVIGDGSDNTGNKSNITVGTESDIAKIIGLNGISITYKDYLITDHYPATDADGQFIYLDATPGYQLLVLRFDVKNITADTVKFTMLDEAVDYTIVCNNKNAANPMLTILLNDLGTMEAVLSPEENQEGVLIFQISDDMQSKLQNMDLKVQYNNAENVIKIL